MLKRIAWTVSALPVATKLSASFCVIALVLMGSITWFNVDRAAHRDLEDEEETMQSLAAATAGRLDQFILDTKKRTEDLAADPDVVELLELPPAVLRNPRVAEDATLTPEQRRVVQRVQASIQEIYTSSERDDRVRAGAAGAPAMDESVFVNVYAPDGSKLGSEDPPDKRADRTHRLNFRKAAQFPAIVDVSSIHVGESRSDASFFHLTKAALGPYGQVGTVTFAVNAALLGYLATDLGAVPEYGSAALREAINPAARPTAVTRCAPAGARPQAREVFLVDRFGAVLLPSLCAGKAHFRFLDAKGRDAASQSVQGYDYPFLGKRTDETLQSPGMYEKLRTALDYEQLLRSRNPVSSASLWKDEVERRERFAAVVPWNGRQRIVGIHPVREASDHGWHVLYTEDVEDAFAPLQAEHRNVFLGLVAALLAAGAILIAIVRFLMRQTRELHEGTWALTHGDLGARIRVLSRDELGQLAESFNTMAAQIGVATNQLETRNRFIRETFGRYLTDEVVETLLSSPTGLAMGGESRTVTILMSDLRGFSSLSEHLSPTEVVSLLNHYLQAMTEVIVAHGGTIDEFIGDAILVLFGAPIVREDHAMRAVTCAVEMQLAMDGVRAHNRSQGLPSVEMGVGIHTGEVVVGNIGSSRRAKYGVVGKPVNLATRIEALTVGGQVLISQATLEAAGPNVDVGPEMHVSLKGVQSAMNIYEVHGIRAERSMSLPPPSVGFVKLDEPLAVRFVVFDGVHSPEPMRAASITAISLAQAVLVGTGALGLRSTVKLQFSDGEDGFIEGDTYAKVLRTDQAGYVVHFTSMPPAVQELVASATTHTDL